MTPPFEELFCYVVVVGYLLWQQRRPSSRGVFTGLLFVAAAAWLTEESCIRLYDFYSYSGSWMLFIGKVPLAVVVVWPVVIHSAGVLAGHLTTKPARVALVAGLIVFTDAALIEPVAVKAGLWSWTQPGLFAVPPIAILGWAIFAALCHAILQRIGETGRGRQAALLLLAPLLTHAALLSLWWGGLRWLNRTVPAWPAVALVWLVAVVLIALTVRHGRRVPMAVLMQRLPGAAFFFVLLALRCSSEPALLAYAAAFAPPYLVLVALGAGMRTRDAVASR